MWLSRRGRSSSLPLSPGHSPLSSRAATRPSKATRWIPEAGPLRLATTDRIDESGVAGLRVWLAVGRATGNSTTIEEEEHGKRGRLGVAADDLDAERSERL